MLIEDLKSKQEEMNALVREAQDRLACAPEGRLRISTSGGSVRRYWVKKGTGSDGIYLAAGEIDLAKKLAQKEYDAKVVRLVQRQSEAIAKLLHNPSWGMASHGIADEFEKLHPAKQALVSPCVLSDEEYASQWQAEKYPAKGFSDESPVLKTKRGERVRSKSEMIIAGVLMGHGIPYHYEKPFQVASDVTIYPDFTVLNKRTRQVFYWEHFGMMDDANYCMHALKRILSYEKRGIFPGQSLILTFEARSLPLSVRDVEYQIDAYLL